MVGSLSNRRHSAVLKDLCLKSRQVKQKPKVVVVLVVVVVAAVGIALYRVVQKKRYPGLNFAITSVNVHRF